MPRTTRSANLETRTARFRLAKDKYHWTAGGVSGLALGYRRGNKTSSWTVRLRQTDGSYITDSVGLADDHHEADGRAVLTYFQAQAKAKAFKEAHEDPDHKRVPGVFAVADAVREYLDWFEPNRRSSHATRSACATHILPALGQRPLAELTTAELRKWHQALAKAPPRVRGKAGAVRHRPIDRDDPERVRGRQATANRVLTVMKAALNHAWREHQRLVPSNRAWAALRPFKGASAARIRFLGVEESTRLINACEPDLRPLVSAALLTGCRYGELIKMRCSDYNAEAGTVLVRYTKNDKPRHVPLTQEGIRLFDQLTAARPGSDVMFQRTDGLPWGKSHQARRLKAACERARIAPAVSFHDLRHSYASALAMNGVPLQVIAEVLGHSDIRLTSKFYAHLMPSFVAETIRKNLPDFGTTTNTKLARLSSGGRAPKPQPVR